MDQNTNTATVAHAAVSDHEWRPERYSDGAFSHSLSTELERLQLLESVLDKHTTARLEILGVGPGRTCLEIGAGAGSVARWMARQGASVIATDLDTKFIEDLPSQEPGLRVMSHDVYTDDFPAASFDVIHARYVLVHLPDQQKAISRLVSWLAPGGVLLIEEPAFFPVENAPHQAYRTVMRAFRDYSEEVIGTDTEWARTLPLPLLSAGLGNVEMEARQQMIRGGDSVASWWQLTLEQTRPHIVARGAVPSAMFDQAYAELNDPAFRDLSLAAFTAWGYRS
ncbi:class I SAM-dependent methyltransferase [Streptomyces sp. NPDC048527]|uniref:class I SAM-dependent methyltransferase n=1 Tax=Streptomyces sp. NPDC048527 TaxID=3365568 RepID=UPI003718A73E